MSAKIKFIGTYGRMIFIAACLVFAFSEAAAQSIKGKTKIFTIDASTQEPLPETGYLQMGSSRAGISPDGKTLTVNSRYLELDGKPWLPVMGEFHYSRYPEKYWKDEILKMKAGGVQIISTYIFWIHQEEIEGKFDWSGRRDLRKFVQLCGRYGLYVYPRIGPWAHGEARNGGFPDWLLAKKCPLRVIDSTFLYYTGTFYDQIGKQLKGLLWKDGGPVIGIQIENEYSNRSKNGGAAYIDTLKNMAVNAGLDVPLYTITGWDNAVIPPHTVIPVYGGYPDAPWSGSIKKLSPDQQGVYQFHVQTPTGTAGIMQGMISKSGKIQLSHYPKFTAELGGGMEDTYHRRVVISGDDIASLALTALGSGDNLIGYYMFHGGTNPEGKLTTLQESQATGYPNDVPVKSYDFQAPLREFGQMNASFRKLKVLHQFIADFGPELATMHPVLPDIVPNGPADTTTLRIAARVNDNQGFIFFNNYLRGYPLPEQKGIQVSLKLKSDTMTIPEKPVNIPPQTYFFWPVNMDLNGSTLRYATAQPFTRINNGDTVSYFFMDIPGINPEFVFNKSSVKSFNAYGGKVSHSGKRIYVRGIKPSTNAAISFKTEKEKLVQIILLSVKQALDSWKIPVHGTNRLFITKADVFSGDGVVRLRSSAPESLSFSVYPPIDEKFTRDKAIPKSGTEGIFEHYTPQIKNVKIPVTVKLIHKAETVPPVKMGPFFNWRNCSVAEAPNDSEFSKAGTWQINLPKEIPSGLSNIFLDINYSGDVARLYSGNNLLDDNFYNGTSWEIGLKRFLPDVFSKTVELKILPLRKDAPVYIRKSLWPAFSGKSQIAKINSIQAIPEYEIKLVEKVNRK